MISAEQIISELYEFEKDELIINNDGYLICFNCKNIALSNCSCSDNLKQVMNMAAEDYQYLTTYDNKLVTNNAQQCLNHYLDYLEVNEQLDKLYKQFDQVFKTLTLSKQMIKDIILKKNDDISTIKILKQRSFDKFITFNWHLLYESEFLYLANVFHDVFLKEEEDLKTKTEKVVEAIEISLEFIESFLVIKVS